MKLKIIHIHSDYKFLSTKNFENDNFQNEIIIIKGKHTHAITFPKNTLCFNNSLGDVSKIVEICNSADIVVLYNLDFTMCTIANRLQKSIKIIWRFFGAELYNKIPDLVYSKSTLIAMREPHIDFFKNIYYKVLSILKLNNQKVDEFYRSIKRIDFFCGVSDLEYDLLKNYWPQLPPFLQWPLSYWQVSNIITPKKNQIIIGNSRSAFNNHIDILKSIQEIRSDNTQYLLLFNYGSQNRYTQVVRKIAMTIKNLKIQEDFLNRDEFTNLYALSSALVINSYRQLALGNIFTALINDVKIYLNENNIIYKWLTQEGFIIFPIQNLQFDLQNNHTFLKEEERIHNQQNIIYFHNKFSVRIFHESILKIASLNKTVSQVR